MSSQDPGVPVTTRASKGSGKAKNKGKKLPTDQFVNISAVRAADDSDSDLDSGNWVAEMNKDKKRFFPPVELPSAPKLALAPEIDIEQVPNIPPFKATLSNLSYDLNEEEIPNLFKNLKVVNVSMHKNNGRFTGNATVEFENRKDLITAFSLDLRYSNRAIKIFLPNQFGGEERRSQYYDNTPSNWRATDNRDTKRSVYPPPSNNYGRDDESRGGYSTGGFGDDMRRPRNDYNRYNDRRRNDRYGDFSSREPRGDSEADDWRSIPRDTRPPSYDSRERDYQPRRDYREPKYDRDTDSGYSNRMNDYRNDSNRGGGRDSYNRSPSTNQDNYEQNYDRHNNYSEPAPRGPVGPPRERTMSSEYDRGVPRGGGPGPHDMPVEEERRRRPPSESVAMPPKQELKATIESLLKPEEVETPASYSSIFGAAKPVNTLKRELEIEKKLAATKISAEPTPEGGAPAEASGPGGERVSESRDGSESSYQKASVPPRHANARKGQERNGGRHYRNDDDYERNGSMGRPRGDYRGDYRMGDGGNRKFGGGGGSRRNDYGRNRDSGYNYHDGPSSRNYGRGGRGGGGGHEHENNSRSYDAYNYHGGNDYPLNDDKVETYTTSNKFAHLNDSDDHL